MLKKGERCVVTIKNLYDEGRHGKIVGESRDKTCWRVQFDDLTDAVPCHKTFCEPES